MADEEGNMKFDDINFRRDGGAAGDGGEYDPAAGDDGTSPGTLATEEAIVSSKSLNILFSDIKSLSTMFTK